jgi:hypothetical protein
MSAGKVYNRSSLLCDSVWGGGDSEGFIGGSNGSGVRRDENCLVHFPKTGDFDLIPYSNVPGAASTQPTSPNLGLDGRQEDDQYTDGSAAMPTHLPEISLTKITSRWR